VTVLLQNANNNTGKTRSIGVNSPHWKIRTLAAPRNWRGCTKYTGDGWFGWYWSRDDVQSYQMSTSTGHSVWAAVISQ